MRRLSLAAGAVTAVLSGVAPAAACCHSPERFAAPTAVLEAPQPVNPFYVAEHGPVYSGAGIYTYNNIWVPRVDRLPYWVAGYPAVQPYGGYAPQYPYVRRAYRGRHCGGCGGFAAVSPYLYRSPAYRSPAYRSYVHRSHWRGVYAAERDAPFVRAIEGPPIPY